MSLVVAALAAALVVVLAPEIWLRKSRHSSVAEKGYSSANTCVAGC
jgi:hypothetical protein